MIARKALTTLATLVALQAPLALHARAIAANAPAPVATPSLSRAQLAAVGIVVGHPTAMTLPLRTAAFGFVLNAAAALTALDARTAARARQRAAAAEAARLAALYRRGAGASLKAVEAERAALVGARGDAESAAARFAARWGPLDTLPSARCRRLIVAAANGRAALLRAQLPGRHAVGALPPRALVDVDGLQVRGRVLGAMRRDGQAGSAAVLIFVARAPLGLGSGARVPVSLLRAPRSGRFVPRDAVLYGPDGAYVYERMHRGAPAGAVRFEAVKVRLIEAHRGGWLVAGVAAHDAIVVRGAGVLWSLQGLGKRADDDDD
ncbi:MAG TPA: hypothetical protein VND80_10755 [Steroidobacteraceae bacterium]|nr:hypothetical protein [Steroidobacteraceae bacterium]